MKVYRVVPDSFFMLDILKKFENDYRTFEDIYYKMGYISFGQNTKHSYNNIYKKLSNQERCGKYFFLFIEDAVWNGLSLLNSFHGIEKNHTFIILEYEIPDDLVLKHIGYGDYARDCFQNYVMECFVTKNDMINNKMSSINISTKEKENGLVYALENSLNAIDGYADAAYFENEFYKKFFNVDNLSEIIHEPNLLIKRLINIPFYKTYMNSQIFQTSFITGNLIYVNDFVDNYHQLIEKIEPRDKRFENVNDQVYFKKELMYYSSQDTEDAKESIKTLLKERYYMK